MEPLSKKNQVKHGKYAPPPFTPTHTHIFPWNPSLLGFTLGDKRTPHPCPEICPNNLSAQYLVVRISKRREGDYANFTKGETFLVS